MTPHEARPGVGTLKVDVVLGKLGRFNRATGTKDPDVARDIVRTLRRLARERRYDLLGPLLEELVTPLELHDAIWRQRVDTLPTSEGIWPLHRTTKRWLEGLDLAERTKSEYRGALLGLGTATTTLAELPGLLEDRRRAAMVSGQRPSFNRLRSAALELLRKVVGEMHPLTIASARAERLRESPRKGNPQSLAAVHKLAAQLGKHAGNLWPLCLTGMRAEEYFGRLYRVVDGAVEIRGTKTPAATRAVPLVYPITPPTCSDDHFRHRLHELTDGDVKPHDLRYTFMRWADNAGIPDRRVRWYAGHTVADVSELYRRGRGFQEFLTADAEKLRAWFGEPPATGLRVVRA